jgi:hypothetical protein
MPRNILRYRTWTPILDGGVCNICGHCIRYTYTPFPDVCPKCDVKIGALVNVRRWKTLRLHRLIYSAPEIWVEMAQRTAF